jgi:hypothetical protein
MEVSGQPAAPTVSPSGERTPNASDQCSFGILRSVEW